MPRPENYNDDAYLDEIDDLTDRRNRTTMRPARRRRLTDEARERRLRQLADPTPEPPDGADRWSTWDDAERGPQPYPDWLVTELAAVDRDLGVLKTGKEADVFLLERYVPETDRSCQLAAKRYRGDEHRLFHRDAGYLEGRRTRKSRERRAMANRSSFGRNLIAEQWAVAEFAALGELWEAGAPVPYPVQRVGRELLLEFLGTPDGTAAPRLAELRPDPAQLEDLWHQLLAALAVLAMNGCTHGDLSAYNLLVHEGRLILIDLPQIVDVVANPQGASFLERDVRNVCSWFVSRGLSPDVADSDRMLELLASEAGIGAMFG